MQPLEPQSSQLGSLPLVPDASAANTQRQRSTSEPYRSGTEYQRSAFESSGLAVQQQHSASNMPRSGTENQRSAFGSSSSAFRQQLSASDLTQTGTSRTPTSTPETYTAVRTGGSLLRDILISLLLFLLLAEWLRPLPTLADISEIYRIQPFLIVFALCIALDCFRVPYTWGWAVKSIIILFFIGFMFEPEGFLNGSWVVDFFKLIVQDVGYVFAARFDLISGETRTLLFLFGWALLISVVQALMLQRQHSLWFVGATLIYLVCLQLALGADTVQGIFRTLGYGLMLLSLLNLSRIQQSYGLTKVSSGGTLLWLTVSLIVVSILAGAGLYSASQAAPTSLMKPVSWANITDRIFELYNEDTGLPAVAAKAGYGHDDSSLGGPLQSDSSIVFTAKTPELTYWRGESKSLYDGKGWTSTEQISEPFISSDHTASGTTIAQEVLWSSKSPDKQLFYGGSLLHIEGLLNDKGSYLSPDIVVANSMTGKVALPEISDPLSFYKIIVQPVHADPALLSSDSDSYPAAIRDAYLQLPDTLPRTVRGLAEQVTAAATSPYAKAVAVEQYLRSNYTYSLEKPTHPTRNEDFVSHFLFVDRTGYCDHFSTSMVVMLRSVGVPARWVKGFAPGTQQAVGEDRMKEVIVRNQDAHSWVEVYFPSAGWVPFEPTPGFTGMDGEHARSPVTISQSERPTMTASLLNIPTMQSFSSDSKEWLQSRVNEVISFVEIYRKQFLLAAVLSVFILGLSVILWRKGIPQNMALIFPVRPSGPVHSQPLVRFMDRLWIQLFRRYGAKSAHQTVREYVTALRLENAEQKQALFEFALIYETVRYDIPGRPIYSKREIAALWNAILSTRDRKTR
ncbi:DUF4129 domain-containing transglutaminase family protein [Paenibacillus sp. GCM10027628]|uniref:DUF4129 domain-containing transglutaminase family protein n=1 Tax=Paenibacillus sp. GCM10027628 TaxID=3273413 RepID=UPI0036335C52